MEVPTLMPLRDTNGRQKRRKRESICLPQLALFRCAVPVHSNQCHTFGGIMMLRQQRKHDEERENELRIVQAQNSKCACRIAISVRLCPNHSPGLSTWIRIPNCRMMCGGGMESPSFARSSPSDSGSRLARDL